MKKLSGVILAGGTGSRLGEVTKVTNKHLLPVAIYPMVYYPIKKLIGIGIKDILIVSGTEHMGDFIELLGSGSRFGASFTYKVQDEAGGIAQALGLAERFSGNSDVLVVLGDNIFKDSLHKMKELYEKSPDNSAIICLKEVPDPGRYGVVEFNGKEINKIIEKPKNPPSNWAVAGIYLYPSSVFDVVKTLKPSKRSELEITDVSNHYLSKKILIPHYLEGYWTDAGTPDSLALANELARADMPNF